MRKARIWTDTETWTTPVKGMVQLNDGGSTTFTPTTKEFQTANGDTVIYASSDLVGSASLQFEFRDDSDVRTMISRLKNPEFILDNICFPGEQEADNSAAMSIYGTQAILNGAVTVQKISRSCGIYIMTIPVKLTLKQDAEHPYILLTYSEGGGVSTQGIEIVADFETPKKHIVYLMAVNGHCDEAGERHLPSYTASPDEIAAKNIFVRFGVATDPLLEDAENSIKVSGVYGKDQPVESTYGTEFGTFRLALKGEITDFQFILSRKKGLCHLSEVYHLRVFAPGFSSNELEGTE